jgi:hypothetical protein
MDYREIQRLAGDPASVRKIAKVLLTAPGLSDRQIDFLSDMAEIKGGITTRQGEFLIGIRDDMQEIATYRDFNVAGLIRKCWIARMDLSEDDEQFIEKLKGRTTIKRQDGSRLLRCAKQLELIHDA